MRRLIVVLLALPLLRVESQNAPGRGTFAYQSRGFFQCDEMETWTAEISVRDTIIGARRAFVMTQRSRFDEGRYRFIQSFAWSDSTPLHVAMVGHGRRAETECTVDFASGQATARSGPEVLGSGAAGIPDFALGAYLSSRALRAGDTLRVTVIRCIPGAPRPFTSTMVTAVVSERPFEGTNGTSTPAWSIAGGAEYPFVTYVGKADRVVLSNRLPQGSVGYQIDTLRR